MRSLIVVLVILTLQGCAPTSLNIQHLQLSAGNAPMAVGESPVIVLDGIDIPDYLLRDELLYRESEFTVRYDAARRWAEPLDLGIQRVLGRRLESILDTQRVILFPDATARPADWQLRVTIEEFEAVNGVVRIAAEGRWEQENGDSIIRESVVYEDTLPLDSTSGDDIAKAMSKLLWTFAEELAAGIAEVAPAATVGAQTGRNTNVETVIETVSETPPQ
ncbi:PqiC family protein [Congregibacter litoralis]|uniref:ABC-type transport auxiliary lipoprotein component domain-containing protein n=1 Tax=Congregibacter litoralis KT71 TaxID=314285 RepID=A4ACJ9_9GAMM|nr:PqiC family protein [Congregibacter litoralis]EAQ96213.1 hypothetical protein KT71_19148 [Congregibacter litoralis KT71]